MHSIDHLAFRVKSDNHEKVCKMFTELFGYEVVTKFSPTFKDGTTQSTVCTVLSKKGAKDAPRTLMNNGVEYQIPPDIFISSSSDESSIVAKWVANRNNIGGLHHIASSVDSVQETMDKFKDAGFEFLSELPLVCEELTQVFTRPSDITNVIYEFIERRQANFCANNVADLMTSTKELK